MNVDFVIVTRRLRPRVAPLFTSATLFRSDIRGVELVPLAERPIVRDLVQLTRALHDLGDRARVSCTRSRTLGRSASRSEEHTSELQSLRHHVCRLRLLKK